MLDAPQRSFLDSRKREAQDETARLMHQGHSRLESPDHKGHKFNGTTPDLPGSQRHDTRRPAGRRGHASLFR
jgi:hypothetical protein